MPLVVKVFPMQQQKAARPGGKAITRYRWEKGPRREKGPRWRKVPGGRKVPGRCYLPGDYEAFGDQDMAAAAESPS